MATEKPLHSSGNGRNAKGQFVKGHKFGFQPGQSGNPAGKPKTALLSDALRRRLADVLPDGRTVAEAIAGVLCDAALEGDVQAAREIADRVEGKARQALDMTVETKDWREIAREHGLDEREVINEARRLIESADDSSRTGFSRADQSSPDE